MVNRIAAIVRNVQRLKHRDRYRRHRARMLALCSRTWTSPSDAALLSKISRCVLRAERELRRYHSLSH